MATTIFSPLEVSVRSLYDEMLAVLDAPLSSVIEPRSQVRVGAVIGQWHLPESDRSALRLWGLPDGPLLRPTPQAGSRPTLTPNVAGEPERRLISADHRLYLLGAYGADFDANLSIRVGAVAGTGRVMGIRARPMTTDDLAEQLRAYHPNLYHPAVCYFNASVAAFVEVAWRWHAAVELLRAHPDPHYTAPLEEHEQHYAEVERSCATFLTRMTSLDPTLGDRDLGSLWVETITDDL
ncbi:SUKH-4 family immunity protein [Micromonospora sediminimaris]|uniref:SUKH-4 family immunity protein n=1 Tax=Micromonospora sediminimaris TaxID=547162 RepID=UPI00379753F4